MEVFATGLGLGESPRWHDGRLWVCDWVAGEVLSYDETGDRRVELTMTGLPFSVDWLPDGRTVLTCDQGVVTADEDGTLTPYGATGQAWNEIVVDPARQHLRQRGRVRPDGWRGAEAGLRLGGPTRRVLRAGGRRRVVPQRHGGDGGRQHARGRRVLRPLPDRRSTSATTARLTNRRVWADLGEADPDGICLDAEGAAWYADVPHQRCVRVAEGGEVLEVVEADRGCFACMLGGEDGRTLYVVADELGRHQRHRPGRADRSGAHPPSTGTARGASP